MDSFTFNKIAGAVLGTCLFGMGLGLVAQAIYAPEIPKKPGYALPLPKEEASGGGQAPVEAPISVRLAKADPKKGETSAKICGACHNFQEGAGAKVGPDLWAVVDRDKASVAGFDYSSALKAKGGKWTFADLDAWLTSPSKYAPGTKMGYAGEEDPQKRADIIRYLDTLAKDPVPLPKPTPEEEKQAQGGGQTAAAGAAPAGGGDDLIKLIADTPPAKGEQAAKICGACHNFQEGAGSKIGPDLYGVVGRDKASVAGFDYSSALKAKGGKWTYEDLNTWLTNPQAYASGTKMGYAGEADIKKRAAIISYLRSLAKTPEPLPASGGEKKADAGDAAKPAAGGSQSDAGAAGGAAGGSFVKLVAEAKPEKGKSAAQICGACHNVKEGEGNKIGPDLYGVVNRDKASVKDFDYSAALKGKGGKWTYDDLNAWLTNPQAFAPGTKMGYAGEPDEKKRAAIVAYLRTLAATPAPLPDAK
ncbi:Cytochrome c (modular protein) [Beijerinckiaceae bacterium RH AL1]|nr:c-type cytochrome [Beijerinckiaceae bacterium]VVB47989.1 Cytochrome c (modular protein) [Beijerinckiaceae bacterium RH CH11]VVB48066.1 Cytochrome c (modular protein) [Beijerinckiaceae bacterium RH AL8]VVC56166.1 Cytochrome c (modular protein) [Beijerinckiaceae bacterium RH AL1]